MLDIRSAMLTTSSGPSSFSGRFPSKDLPELAPPPGQSLAVTPRATPRSADPSPVRTARRIEQFHRLSNQREKQQQIYTAFRSGPFPETFWHQPVIKVTTELYDHTVMSFS